MRLDATAFGPNISLVMVPNIGQQERGVGLVHDDADVIAGADRPEVLIARTINAVELQPRRGRVELQIEGGGLRYLLLVSGEPAQSGGEAVGDTEFEAHTVKTFITSSPKWLMTLTAIRPLCGRRNGRDTSR